jgi:hypothetical protein
VDLLRGRLLRKKMTTKKKLLYFGVALIGAYLVLPQAQTMVDYLKNKLKSKSKKDIDNKQKKDG